VVAVVFSDACMTTPIRAADGRPQKSAKARNRGMRHQWRGGHLASKSRFMRANWFSGRLRPKECFLEAMTKRSIDRVPRIRVNTDTGIRMALPILAETGVGTAVSYIDQNKHSPWPLLPDVAPRQLMVEETHAGQVRKRTLNRL
jgi:hypothetical protein